MKSFFRREFDYFSKLVFLDFVVKSFFRSEFNYFFKAEFLDFCKYLLYQVWLDLAFLFCVKL